jgi:hypothetical protein
MKFQIAVTWSMYDTYDVEADSIEEAMKLIREGNPPYDFLPKDPQYIDGSLEINTDMTRELN